jgi:hypothetical protein
MSIAAITALLNIDIDYPESGAEIDKMLKENQQRARDF